MKVYTAAILLVAIIIINGCQGTEAENNSTATDDAKLALGFQLLETNCFSCHSPDASMDNRIAPPMVAVKRHYIDGSVSEATFTAELTEWVINPDSSKTKMPGAIQKFGVMPKMGFDEEQLAAIAYYIYHTELEQPDWFEQHYQEEHGKYLSQMGQGQGQSYLTQGKQYALATKAILGKNLLSAINTKGTEGALDFCNIRAIPLTDSMQQVQNVSIKRVSDNNRNPDNVADANELAYIFAAKAALQNGETIQGKIAERNGKMVGYYPILTNEMCLQCHGKPGTDIKAETLTKIKELYPNDKATGYAVDELRGIWVVEMPMSSDQ